MNQKKALFAVLFQVAAFPTGLGAFSSPLKWLSGTRPYETVSAWECNLETSLDARFEKGQDAGFSGDFACEAGLLDHLSAGAGMLGRFNEVKVFSQLRFSEAEEWPLDLAVLAEVKVYGNAGEMRPQGGVILGREIGEHSLAANMLWDTREGLRLSLAYRSPFFMSVLRAGLEARVADADGGWTFCPQVFALLPGDLSFTLGGEAGQTGAWALKLRFGLLLFPSP